MTQRKSWVESTFVDVPVEGLASPALDWAVGYALGRPPHVLYMLACNNKLTYSASADILETAAHNYIVVVKDHSDGSFVARSGKCQVRADTPQVAVMRCMLQTRYGDTVQVPEPLLELRSTAEPRHQVQLMDIKMPRLTAKPAKQPVAKQVIEPVEQEDYSAQFAAIDEIARFQG